MRHFANRRRGITSQKRQLSCEQVQTGTVSYHQCLPMRSFALVILLVFASTVLRPVLVVRFEPSFCLIRLAYAFSRYGRARTIAPSSGLRRVRWAFRLGIIVVVRLVVAEVHVRGSALAGVRSSVSEHRSSTSCSLYGTPADSRRSSQRRKRTRPPLSCVAWWKRRRIGA